MEAPALKGSLCLRSLAAFIVLAKEGVDLAVKSAVLPLTFLSPGLFNLTLILSSAPSDSASVPPSSALSPVLLLFPSTRSSRNSAKGLGTGAVQVFRAAAGSSNRPLEAASKGIIRPQGRSGASSVLNSAYGAPRSMNSSMAKGVSGLEYSWKRLMSTQTLGVEPVEQSTGLREDTEDVNRSLQGARPGKAEASGYFGGLLNNLNDPSKRPKRDYRPRPGRGRVNPLPDCPSEECLDMPPLQQVLLCRGLSASSGALRKRAKHLISPCTRLKPILNWDLKSDLKEGKLSITLGRVAFNSRSTGKEKHKKPPKPPSLMTSTGVGTCDQTDYTVALRKERARELSGSVGATPKARKQGRSLVSQWLEHMLTEQPHVRRKGRTVLYSRGLKPLPCQSFTALLAEDFPGSALVPRPGKSLLF